MNKTSALLLATVFFFAGTGVALSDESSLNVMGDTSSNWSYPSATASSTALISDVDIETGGKPGNPHDIYDSASGSCKMCHEMPAIGGAYRLLRTSRPDDACAYCHVGGSAFSALQVYGLNSAGMKTANGHTIGASELIPDSSVAQWVEQATVTTTDADGNSVSQTIALRRYSKTANKLFRLSRYDGPNPVDPSVKGFLRVGPVTLNCMSCHFPHNTEELVWTPTALESQSTTGAKRSYKLLRSSPSGSIQGKATIVNDDKTYRVDYDEGMKTWKAYTELNPQAGDFYVGPDHVVTVPEETMTAVNTGAGHTIYTTFNGVDARKQRGPIADPQTVNEYALSPWCADCHNLNIGYWKNPPRDELGFASHADRTHPAPFTGAYNGPGQCYSCHRNDLPDAPGQRNQPSSLYAGYTKNAEHQACEECHFGTGSYRQVRDNVDGLGARSDFPHSGQDNAIKLLGPATKRMNADGAIIPGIGVTEDNIDGVCLRCHPGVGVNH